MGRRRGARRVRRGANRGRTARGAAPARARRACRRRRRRRAAGPAAPCAASRARLDVAASSCPSSDFFTELYNADFACKPAVLVDVGANKGYVVAEMLAIFAPALGVAPPALGAAIAASGAAFNEVTGCGICDDCKHTPPPSSAAHCAAQARVVVHAFEPVPDNVDMLNLRLGPLLRAAPGAGAAAAAAAAAVSLHVHAAAVVEDAAATPSVVVSNCRGGGEGCGVLGAGAAEGADAVRVPAVSLDAWAAGAGVASIDLLFIDAEGADPLVLRGAAALLGAGRVRALVFEYKRTAVGRARASATSSRGSTTTRTEVLIVSSYSKASPCCSRAAGTRRWRRDSGQTSFACGAPSPSCTRPSCALYRNSATDP